jgi:hypothetical protein
MKAMLFIIILFFNLIGNYVLAGDNPVTAWGKQFGISLEALKIAADKSGNCFIAGTTSDSLSSSYAGRKDLFIKKVNFSGDELWTMNLGTDEDEYCYSSATDPDGNCFLVGKTVGNFASGNIGNYDAIIVKVNPSGDIIWKKQFGTSQADDFKFILIDKSGDCFVCGSTNGNFDGNNAGGSDAIIIKLNSNGDILWKKQYGTSAAESAEYIGLDKNNSSYFVLSSKEIVKLDAAGNFVTKFKHNLHQVRGIVTDDSLNIYIGGTTGVTNGSKAILIKYNKDWIKQWERSFGTGSWTGINSLTKFQDGTNDILVGVCQNYPTCLGVSRRYDLNGNVKWIYTLQKSGINSVCGVNITIDGTGNCFLTGFTDGSLFSIKIKSQETFLSKIVISDQSDIKEKGSFPFNFDLRQNFPNPFNPTTRITYSIPLDSQVKITVFSINGKTVRTLLNKYQAPGQYSVDWDGIDNENIPVSSGIYLYKLETSDQIISKKMVLLR